MNKINSMNSSITHHKINNRILQDKVCILHRITRICLTLTLGREVVEEDQKTTNNKMKTNSTIIIMMVFKIRQKMYNRQQFNKTNKIVCVVINKIINSKQKHKISKIKGRQIEYRQNKRKSRINRSKI